MATNDDRQFFGLSPVNENTGMQSKTSANPDRDYFGLREPEELPSRTESALRGFNQGVTFGLSDELAALPYLFPGGKTFREDLAENRAIHEAAARQNPGSYYSGLGAGAVGSAFIPGVGLLGNAARGAMGASRLGKGVQAAAQFAPKYTGRALGQGALAGYGYSDAETIPEVALDTAQGAGLGLLGNAAFRGIGVGGSKAYSGVSKELGRIGGIAQSVVPHQLMRRLIASGTLAHLSGGGLPVAAGLYASPYAVQGAMKGYQAFNKNLPGIVQGTKHNLPPQVLNLLFNE